MEELLDYVFRELEARSIDYMLSGSVAMNIYTVPRFTRNADIVIELREDNFATFSEIFANRANYFHSESAAVEVRRKGMFNVLDWTSGFKIDFIVKRNEAFQEAEFQRRQRRVVLGRVEGWVISVEDLILAKLMWIQDLQSGHQITDIQSLIEDNPQIDSDCIRQWIKILSLKTFNVI